MRTVWGLGKLRGSVLEEAERAWARLWSCESELTVKEQGRCFGPSKSCHTPGLPSSQVRGPEAPPEWCFNEKTDSDLQKEKPDCNGSSPPITLSSKMQVGIWSKKPISVRRLPSSSIWECHISILSFSLAPSLCEIWSLSLHLEGVQYSSLFYAAGCWFPLMYILSCILASLSCTQLLFVDVRVSCEANWPWIVVINIARDWPAVFSTMCTVKCLCDEADYGWIFNHMGHV